MTIQITNGYIAYVDFNSLGYQGETNARTVDIDQPVVSGADTYRLRIEYADGVIYDVPIIDGKVAVTASMLRLVGTVECQWLATKVVEDSYALVAKSNVFTLEVRASISDDVAPIPTPEIALSALDEIREKAVTVAENSESAQQSAEQAQTYAETAQNASETAIKESDKVSQALEKVASYASTASDKADIATEQANIAAEKAEEITTLYDELNSSFEQRLDGGGVEDG
ncbi:MAG: hypothetical protein ACI4I7_01410 [Oscillospiraceae bacterium]